MRKRSTYRPKPVVADQRLFFLRACAISSDDVNNQCAIATQALQILRTNGAEGLQAWRSLADTANMAETLAAMGLGSGPEADALISDAQEALSFIVQGQQITGRWSVRPEDDDALQLLIDLHCVQLRACSYGEQDTALTRTKHRMEQARAGNAAPGTIVVTGEIGVAA